MPRKRRNSAKPDRTVEPELFPEFAMPAAEVAPLPVPLLPEETREESTSAMPMPSGDLLPDTPLGLDPLFERLARSPFRSRFRLHAAERSYIEHRGLATLRRHAEEFVRTRLAAASPPNDGRQTPMRGHPVFVAQHATGCCCRNCLAKWHGIPAGRPLTDAEQQYIVRVLMTWISRQLEC